MDKLTKDMQRLIKLTLSDRVLRPIERAELSDLSKDYPEMYATLVEIDGAAAAEHASDGRAEQLDGEFSSL